eukprot:TRINITY_DN1673_c0_g1_i1.p1 TRINITY_DN1673_c0_g1~~TRINITY_DN1673_c0_g1_i1.p1  ORF type:complete len:196 (+),score=15.08 TRINITY_DN1673_c0_g1_i1:61-648(+)
MQRFNVQRFMSAARSMGVLKPASSVSAPLNRNLFTQTTTSPLMSSRQTNVCMTKKFASLFAVTRTATTAAPTASAAAEPAPDVFQKHYFHKSAIGLVAVIPAALILSPGHFLTPLVDIALSVLLPFHGHFGMQLVLQDYAYSKKWAQPLLYAVTLLTMIGLFFISGTLGLSKTVKSLWVTEVTPDGSAAPLAKKH